MVYSVFEASSSDVMQLPGAVSPNAQKIETCTEEHQESGDGIGDGSSTMCGSRRGVEGHVVISVPGYASGQ
jgi:hypothetical protein